MNTINVYFDSNAFERLTKKGTENDWNGFINECEKFQIDILNGCNIIFSPFVLLERIGLGEILKELLKSQEYETIKNFVQLFTHHLPYLEQQDDSLKQKIANFLEVLELLLTQLVLQIKDLNISSILHKLQEEISIYATSSAGSELKQKTLTQYYDHLSNCFDKNLFARSLVWNLIATFPFINVATTTKTNSLSSFQKSTLWTDSLFAFSHDKFIKGYDLNFARLIDSRYYSYTQAIAKDKKHPQYTRAKQFLSQYKPYHPNSDLCDGELIHFATLGKQMDGHCKKVICFTCDDFQTITTRLSVMKSSLEDAQRDVQNWAIKPCWGEVHCLTKKGEPLKIVHRFYEQKPNEPE
ncbi:MAG: hypothetical protein HKM07_01780 [Chlamydiae bacterium]|nr:hypothetical protein [Chlamydiota bacterium]